MRRYTENERGGLRFRKVIRHEYRHQEIYFRVSKWEEGWLIDVILLLGVLAPGIYFETEEAAIAEAKSKIERSLEDKNGA